MFAVSAIHTNRGAAGVIARREQERKERERLERLERIRQQEAAALEAKRQEMERREQERLRAEALEKMAAIVCKYREIKIATDKRMSVKEIIAYAVQETTYGYDDIVGKRRTREMANYRHYAILCAWALRTDMSLPMLGHQFGGRDHTTILSSIRRFGFDSTSRQAAAAFVKSHSREDAIARLSRNQAA